MSQPTLFEYREGALLDLEAASGWASQYLNRRITTANISYLLRYGRITRHGNGGSPLINREELKDYYDSSNQEGKWKSRLGEDLNWNLSFTEFSEAERTKHVHRLHPYKGKFIPQLVAYFLDDHTDAFKQEVWFHTGDVVLDPFCGSGTTLVQASELGMHAIGIDISSFNGMITNAKVARHDIAAIGTATGAMTTALREFQQGRNNVRFERRLHEELATFNAQWFPTPEYRIRIRNGEIDEHEWSTQKARLFLKTYEALLKRYRMVINQSKSDTFLDKWYLAPVRDELEVLFRCMQRIEDRQVRAIVAIILSRTARSCRATTHADLGTLKEPVGAAYYCRKHGKICKPLFSIAGWWQRYTADTINRLQIFDRLRSDTYQCNLTGDSRAIDLPEALAQRHARLADRVARRKIQGIFSSPPYVGLIDYHEQHAYAYDLFGLDRNDDLEIGPLSKGQGREARAAYVRGISAVLKQCKQYLQEDYNVFLVANDKYNLYPQIAELASMKIVQRFRRPVLNRVEKDRSAAYSETIFRLKER